LKDFNFKNHPTGQNKLTLNIINNTNSVSLHIRRGDYIKNLETYNKHGLIDLYYYYKAINYIKEHVYNPTFFIFSDDITWAKENLNIELPVYFIDFNDQTRNYEDLRLMKNCKYNIIANSSFSWWGAWLNDFSNKIVIAPKKWFNDDTINTYDLTPLDWILI
jgi:hypothetical protein